MSRPDACATVRARLSPYLDGHLPARAELVVRRHLAGCAACRGSARRTGRIGVALAELSFDAPVGLAERVRRTERRTERRRARAVGVRRGLARASAALVVFSAAAFAGLAGLQAARGTAPVTPRLSAPTVADGPAPCRVPPTPAPAGLRRVADGPALADWARVREGADAADWIATDRLAADGEVEASAPASAPGATAGFRAPR